MIEAHFDSNLQELLVSRIISSFKILKRMSGDEDGFMRGRCILINNSILEFAEYVTVEKNKVQIVTYSFHWQSAAGTLIKRWDNVPHHKNIATFPSHLHASASRVLDSPPINLKKALSEIEKTLRAENPDIFDISK